MMERKRECRELHEICSRLGNLGRRLRFPVYLGKEFSYCMKITDGDIRISLA